MSVSPTFPAKTRPSRKLGRRNASSRPEKGRGGAAGDGTATARVLDALCDLTKACAHAEAARVPQAVIARATQTLGAHSASLMLRERNGDDHDTLRMAASVGLPHEIATSVTLLVGERIAGRVAATGVPIRVSGDPRRHPLLSENGHVAPDIAPRPEVESALCVPLTDAHGIVLGVLSLSRYRPSPPFTDADLSLASLFASCAGARIAEEQLCRDAQTRGEEFSALERLAASVAHEMRNPLASIKGAAQFVQRKLDGSNADAACDDFLALVVEEADNLARLASDLIEWARPTMERVTTPAALETRDLVTVVRGQMSLLSPELTAMGVAAMRFCGDDAAPAWASVDGAGVGRAVRNLLLNAAQSATQTAARPCIVVSLIPTSLVEPKGEEQTGARGYEIVVDDNGAGVPVERRETIWEPFVTHKARGVGLGLAQVQAVAQMHSGIARCEESPTLGGARFVLFLPTGTAAVPVASLPPLDAGFSKDVC